MKRFLLLALLFLLPSIAFGAITFDSANNGSNCAPCSSLTWTHTMGTGTQGIIFVGIEPISQSDIISSVSDNGVSMQKVSSSAILVGSDREGYLWYTTSTTQGVNTISVSSTASVNMYGASVSYYGVDQSAPIDSTASGYSATTANLTVTSTVVASNSWLVGFNVAFDTVTAGTGSVTDYLRAGNVTSQGLFDSSSTVGTGAQSLGFHIATTNKTGAIVASIKPSSAQVFPSISLSTSTYSLSTNATSGTEIITNVAGSGSTLNWAATSTQIWLTTSPVSGADGSNATSLVKIITSSSYFWGQPAGTYNATLTFSDANATNSPQTAHVTVITYDSTSGGGGGSCQTLSTIDFY